MEDNGGWMELRREIYRNGELIETIEKGFEKIEFEVTEGIIK
jgi:hypothetical protein